MTATGERFGYLLVGPAFLLLGLFVLAPIVSTMLTSLYVDDQTLRIRAFVGLQNYADLVHDTTARRAITFTLLFVGTSVTAELLVGLAFALVIHRGFRGQGLARAAVLIPWAIPTVVTAILWKYLLNDQYGVINLLLYGRDLPAYQAWLTEPATARMAIILADVWKTSSFAALLLLAGLQTIPDELYEAARVDGAGPVRRFLTITLPLLRPAVLVALLFRLMDAFRVFDLVFVMTEGGPFGSTSVLQFYGYKQMFAENQFGYGAAVSVVVFGMIAIVGALTIRAVGTRLFER